MRKTLFKKNTHSSPRPSPDRSTPDSLENQELENQESADLDLSVFVYILLGFFALLGAYNLIF